MKITCEKNILLDALSIGQRALASKSSIQAIEGYLLSGNSEGLLVSSFNLETGIITSIPATASSNESTVINGRIFYDIIRRLPDDVVTITTNDSQIANIRCGMAEFNIMTLPSSEFPELPKIDSEKRFSMPQGLLKNMISQTIFSTAQNDNKPILTGCCFDVRGSVLRIAALDSYRLSFREEELTGLEGIAGSRFVVPATALREVEKILKDDEGSSVSVSLSRKHITFDMGKTLLFCRLLEGEFTNYDEILPKSARYSVIIDNSVFLESLERVSILISEQQKTPVRLRFDKNCICFSTTTSMGSGYDECIIRGDAEGFEIGMSSRWLSDALHSIDADEALMEFNGSMSPCVIRPVTGSRFLHLIAPARLSPK